MARVTRRRPHGSTRRERGAAAVEFALVAPLLFIILFGIIDYGIWFSDSISARQAVRDGARRGVVENFGACTPAGATGADQDLQNLACTTRAGMEPISGTTCLKIGTRPPPLPRSTGPSTGMLRKPLCGSAR